MSGPLNKVIILGAGASVPAGAPTMQTFLDRARLIRRHDLESNDDIAAFDAVLESLRDLAANYEKANIDLNNLEEVFGAIEMAQLIGKLADQSEEQIKKLRDQFIRMVVRTLQLTVRFRNVEGSIGKPAAATVLGEIIQNALQRQVGISIISFNYDLVMEMALKRAGLHHDYGLLSRAAVSAQVPSVPLLKLHGSMNWHFCDACKEVYDAGTFSFGSNTYRATRDRNEVIVNLGAPLARSCSQVPAANSSPVIVPPSWDKSRYQNSLRNVWARAAQELARADEVHVIGYSLPETDAFFRHLFALATQSRTRIARMLVVNPDNGVRQKFERFIGQGLLPQLQFSKEGKFEEALNEIGQKLLET